MRRALAIGLCMLACCLLISGLALAVPGSERSAGRVVLVPIDDRPAVTQFTEWIGRIGDVEVVMPPREMLGTFTSGGQPEQIVAWLKNLDYKNVDALILSVDMLAYGGLMTSRTPATPLALARSRLETLKELRARNPRLPVYAFNAVQRVALSASASNRSYRDRLTRWAVLAHQTQMEGGAKLNEEFGKLTQSLPAGVIQDYLATRARNLQINYFMLDLARSGVVNELLLLQDDAQPYGLHRRDQRELRERILKLKLTDIQARLYNGADEGSSVLLSRATLRQQNFEPRIHAVFSSEAGRKAVGTFEDQTIETSVERQITASGARLVTEPSSADYTLYVNAPEQTEDDFQRFIESLLRDIKSGRPVAIADVLFKNHWGGSDPRLIEALGSKQLLDQLVGYASWNTPGNTIGTVVPQANMLILARRKFWGDPVRAARLQSAHVGFLLHRYIGDYGYHTIVRPAVNKHARTEMKLEVDELSPQTYELINRMVADRMSRVAEDIFDKYFKGRFYSLGEKDGGRGVRLRELRGLKVRLPWARTFEVRVDYDLSFTRETRNGVVSKAER